MDNRYLRRPKASENGRVGTAGGARDTAGMLREDAESNGALTEEEAANIG
ncbi:hypothetical protein [Streptomyces purpurogeneiscleroticus]|nr:hypothetical protein [Streptomyces purpurogeneiscleroticus]